MLKVLRRCRVGSPRPLSSGRRVRNRGGTGQRLDSMTMARVRAEDREAGGGTLHEVQPVPQRLFLPPLTTRRRRGKWGRMRCVRVRDQPRQCVGDGHVWSTMR
jgi:hypothetical protein